MRIDPDEWVDAYNDMMSERVVWKGDGTIRDLRDLAGLPEEEQMAAVREIVVGALCQCHSSEEQWWEHHLRDPVEKWLRRAQDVKEGA